MKFTKSKKGKIYYDLYVKGYKEHTVAPDCTNEDEAEAYKEKRRKIVELMIDGDIPPDERVSAWLTNRKTATDLESLKKGDIITVSLMCKNYEHNAEERYKIKNKKVDSSVYSHTKFFKSYFGETTDITMIAKFNVLKMRSYIKTHHKSKSGGIITDAAVNRYVTALKRCYNLFRDAEILDYNPCDRIKPFKESQNRNVILPLEKEDEFLSYIPEMQSDMILLDLNTGLRMWNLFNLKKSQIDFANEKIVIEAQLVKGKRIYEIPLNEIAIDIIKKYYDKADDYLFINKNTGKPLTTIKTTFKRAARLIGIPELYPHDIRRTFGTRVYNLTRDIRIAQKLLCHTKSDVTERYIVIVDEKSNSTVTLLAEAKKTYQEKKSNIIDIAQSRKEKEEMFKLINKAVG